MIVADTSLIASLLLSTKMTPAAEAVLEKDPVWTAPPLWRYGFKNVLATQVRLLGLPLDHAVMLFEKADEILSEAKIEVALEAILWIAQAGRLSAYDAEFVGLAYALKVKVITADKGILSAARDVAISIEDFARN